jgi:hypothetical protein
MVGRIFFSLFASISEVNLWVNFTEGYRTIRRFHGMVPNYHFSRTRVLNYQKPSHKGIMSGFGVKS